MNLQKVEKKKKEESIKKIIGIRKKNLYFFYENSIHDDTGKREKEDERIPEGQKSEGKIGIFFTNLDRLILTQPKFGIEITKE